MNMPIDKEQELQRLPGLYRAFEVENHFADKDRFRSEKAGALRDGTPLFFIYIRADEALGDYVGELLCSLPDAPPCELHCELCGGGPDDFELIEGGHPGERLAICKICGAEQRIDGELTTNR